jgi:hypothetical protein
MSSLSQSALESFRRSRALAFVWLTRLLVAWVISSPLARALTAQGSSDLPRGDAVLFDPGGLWLVEALRLGWPVLRSELRGSLLLGSVLAWLSLIPLGVLIAALASPRRTPLSHSVSRAIAAFPRLTLLVGATLLVQAAAVAASVFAALALQRRLATSWDERSSDLCALGVLGVGLLLAVGVGVVQDLARVALVAEDIGALQATRRALATVRRRAAGAFGAWAATSAIGLALTLAAAVLVGAIDVSRSGEWRVVLVTILHQAAVLSLVFCRATWLAGALDLIRKAPPASVDKSGDSGELVGPSPHPTA